MPFPVTEGKHAFRSILEPQATASLMREHGALPDGLPPSGVVFCYSRRLLRWLAADEGMRDFL